MSVTPERSGAGRGGGAAAGILAVAATYVFFLIYAQFGFLALLALHGLSTANVGRVMASMGIAGLLASLATGRLLAFFPARGLLAWGFVGCAATALLSLVCRGIPALMGIAALIGLFTALLTVSLAAGLRGLVGGHRFGSAVGLGTGLAYLFCNLPPVFAGSPARQACLAALACVVGLAAVLGQRERAAQAAAGPPPSGANDTWEARGLGFVSIVLSFLALIWLDSAAFAVIQETVALKGKTWGSPLRQLMLGATHFLAAVGAGWLIDRGRFRGLLLAAYVLFVTAFMLLLHGAGPGLRELGGPLYAVGISLYSVALVVFPSRGPEGPGLVARRWRAALLYGIAGWLGSALGVGMAQDLHTVPPLFLAITGLLLLAAWVLARGWLGRLLRVWGPTLACGLAAIVFYALGGEPGAVAPTAVARGRQVYIAEGCINCHSQYVRPSAADTALWGPHRSLDRQQAPPLLGNRRQGPDLSNVATRRSAAWQRFHLRTPRSLSPGSRMPDYDHLFRGEGERGEDLVAFLDSLGTEVAEERYAQTQAQPLANVVAAGGEAGRGRQVFQRYCAVCHGPQGRGDGPLATALGRPAMNLRKGTFWLVSWGPGAAPLEEGLARLIKFGLPGTSMPGHEYLTDRQLADVVAYVAALGRKAESG